MSTYSLQSHQRLDDKVKVGGRRDPFLNKARADKSGYPVNPSKHRLKLFANTRLIS